VADVAKHEGLCRACRQTIRPDEPIRRGTLSWIHDDCREPELPRQPDENAAAAAWADRDADPF
jgi:hypothetical protein